MYEAITGQVRIDTIRGLALPVMIVAGALGAPFVAYLVDYGVPTFVVWQLGLIGMLLSGLIFFFIKPPRM